jgi:hypothetical protein
VSEPAIETAEGGIGWAVTGPDGEIVATGPQTVLDASADAGQEQ